VTDKEQLPATLKKVNARKWYTIKYLQTSILPTVLSGKSQCVVSDIQQCQV